VSDVISKVIGAILRERNLYIVRPQNPTMSEIALEAYGYGRACDAAAILGDDLQTLLTEIGERCAGELSKEENREQRMYECAPGLAPAEAP
jgi:hypothetical protein